MDVRKLIRPPKFCRFNETKEKKTTWTELFYDLVFVFAITVIGGRLNQNVSILGVIEFVALFIAVWWSWIGYTFYNDRFDTDDVFHRVMTLLNMLGVAAMAILAHQVFRGEFNGFVIAYMFVRFLIMISFYRAGVYVKKAKDMTDRYVLGYTLELIILGIGVLVQDVYLKLAIWGCAGILHFLIPFVSLGKSRDLPFNSLHLRERFGLFTIILLGETLVSAINPAVQGDFSLVVYLSVVFGITVSFVVWWLYFQNVEVTEFKDFLGVPFVWAYSHLPFKMGLILLAVGVNKVVAAIGDGSFISDESLLLNIGSSFIIFWLAVIDLVTTFPKERDVYEGVNAAGKFMLSLVPVSLVWMGISVNLVLNFFLVTLVYIVVLCLDIFMKRLMANRIVLSRKV